MRERTQYNPRPEEGDEVGESNAQAIIDAVERLVQPTEIQLEDDEQGRPRVIALPKGLELKSLKPFEDERRERPERRSGTAHHTTLASFCAAVTRFSDPHSAIFADDNPKAPRLTAVFDYHEANTRDENGKLLVEGDARFGQHRAVYAFPLSQEWLAWTRLPESLSQRDFAEFLEEHVANVMDPERVGEGTRELAEQLGITIASPSQLLTLSRGLAVRVESKVVQANNLSTGEMEIQYEETHKDRAGGGPLKVPSGFVLSIPVFRGGAPYAIVARLRYRVQGAAITWRIMLHRADDALRDAFGEACEEAEKTGVPLFYGSPES